MMRTDRRDVFQFLSGSIFKRQSLLFGLRRSKPRAAHIFAAHSLKEIEPCTKKEMPETRVVAWIRRRTLFLSVLISYGTIAATSLEYKLSSLLASTAVTT
jgi:hypothetical protein